MLLSRSILSRFANRLFGGRTSHKRVRRCDLRRRDDAPVHRAAEVMEERALLSATFAAAIGVGSTGQDATRAVTTDGAGNRYVTGNFTGTVDFDPGHNTAGDTLTAATSTGYIAKYAPDNTLQWVRQAGAQGNAITLDASGNVYVAGGFGVGGSNSFGSTTLTSAGASDGFVTKLNASGTFQWAKGWGTSANEGGMGVGVDSSGNVYTVGDALGGSYTILKYSSTGRAVWSESIAANIQTTEAGFAVDASGDVFLAGGFPGTVDFDPGNKTYNVSSGANYSSFVEKFDTNGNFKWVSSFVGSGTTFAESLALDGSGNIVVGGLFGGSVDFNPGSGTTILSSPGSNSGYITKLNSSGGLVWADALQSSYSGYVRGLTVDTAGNIYATGNYNGTIDLDPGAGTDLHTTAGSGDVFVIKLDAAGNLVWDTSVGGAGVDIGFGIAVDTNGNVVVVGYYNQTVDFDPDPIATYWLNSNGGADGFLLTLSQS